MIGSLWSLIWKYIGDVWSWMWLSGAKKAWMHARGKINGKIWFNIHQCPKSTSSASSADKNNWGIKQPEGSWKATWKAFDELGKVSRERENTTSKPTTRLSVLASVLLGFLNFLVEKASTWWAWVYWSNCQWGSKRNDRCAYVVVVVDACRSSDLNAKMGSREEACLVEEFAVKVPCNVLVSNSVQSSCLCGFTG